MNKQDDGTAKTRMPTAAELLSATETGAPDVTGTVAKRGGTSRRQGGEKDGGIAALGAALGLTESPDARALREAADAEPGVRSRSCLIRTDDDTGGTTVIVSIAVAYGLALHAVADSVRERVAVAAVDVLGIAPPAEKAAGKAAGAPAAKAASKASPRGTAKSKAKAAQADGRLRVDVKVVWLDEPEPTA